MKTPKRQHFLAILFSICIAPCLLFSQEYKIHELLKDCNSRDAIVVYNAIQLLQEYEKHQFDDLSKVMISELLNENTKHLNKIIRIAGFVGLEDELLAFAQKKKWSKNITQELDLAITRSGNVSKTKSLLRGISKIPTNDAFSYNVVPLLIYARQKPIMDNLLSRILEDGENCYPADMEIDGEISCAYPIIEQVAPYIEDFPVSNDGRGVIATDYPEMLKVVRDWIKANMESYVINYEKY